jgi:hypothetical protein
MIVTSIPSNIFFWVQNFAKLRKIKKYNIIFCNNIPFFWKNHQNSRKKKQISFITFGLYKVRKFLLNLGMKCWTQHLTHKIRINFRSCTCKSSENICSIHWLYEISSIAYQFHSQNNTPQLSIYLVIFCG